MTRCVSSGIDWIVRVISLCWEFICRAFIIQLAETHAYPSGWGCLMAPHKYLTSILISCTRLLARKPATYFLMTRSACLSLLGCIAAMHSTFCFSSRVASIASVIRLRQVSITLGFKFLSYSSISVVGLPVKDLGRTWLMTGCASSGYDWIVRVISLWWDVICLAFIIQLAEAHVCPSGWGCLMAPHKYLTSFLISWTRLLARKPATYFSMTRSACLSLLGCIAVMH